MKLNHESLENRSLLAACDAIYESDFTLNHNGAVLPVVNCVFAAPILITTATDTLAFTIEGVPTLSLNHIFKTGGVSQHCVTEEAAGNHLLNCLQTDKAELKFSASLKLADNTVAASSTCTLAFADVVSMPIKSQTVAFPALTVGTLQDTPFGLPFWNSTTNAGANFFGVTVPTGNVPVGLVGAGNEIVSLQCPLFVHGRFMACADGSYQIVEVFTDAVGAPAAVGAAVTTGTAITCTATSATSASSIALGATPAQVTLKGFGLADIQSAVTPGTGSAIDYNSNANTDMLNAAAHQTWATYARDCNSGKIACDYLEISDDE